MNFNTGLILSILAATIALFLWGRWRHDVVAMASLLTCVLTGLVPAGTAFVGFGHPAVITVACVLVLSFGLQKTGAVDSLTRRVLKKDASPTVTLATLIGLGALLSAFMNNVGAMALLMPVALQMADKNDIPPGKVLMPLAFGTILGGMTTLIGTPPNLIVSGFRAGTEAGGFGMFDYSPVGLAVAGTGILFLVVLGRKLVPMRKGSQANHFNTEDYLTEVHIDEGSKAKGLTLRAADEILKEADAQIVGLLRNGTRISIQNRRWILREHDVLVIKADPESFASALSSLGLSMDLPKDAAEKAEMATDSSEEVVLQELVILPRARLIGRSADAINLRTRYGISLLAISRRDRRITKRLSAAPAKAGDVLLVQGSAESLAGFAADFGCVPLAQRSISIPNNSQAILASAIMIGAIAVAAFGILPADISFAVAVLLYILTGVLSPRAAYNAIDWPIVLLLAGMIPVAGAMASTGAADWLAKGLLETIARGHPVVALTLVLVVTMTLSDFMNNAATAAVMCPLAISTATQLGVASDAFLMAVAIGASCAFLTPIGHQNNTLILGPGGLRFGDYWRLGLPMEIIVVLVSIPVLLWAWPL